jgi:hypothetical protein
MIGWSVGFVDAMLLLGLGETCGCSGEDRTWLCIGRGVSCAGLAERYKLLMKLVPVLVVFGAMEMPFLLEVLLDWCKGA